MDARTAKPSPDIFSVSLNANSPERKRYPRYLPDGNQYLNTLIFRADGDNCWGQYRCWPSRFQWSASFLRRIRRTLRRDRLFGLLRQVRGQFAGVKNSRVATSVEVTRERSTRRMQIAPTHRSTARNASLSALSSATPADCPHPAGNSTIYDRSSGAELIPVGIREVTEVPPRQCTAHASKLSWRCFRPAARCELCE
jgi:hypothetical protein